MATLQEARSVQEEFIEEFWPLEDGRAAGPYAGYINSVAIGAHPGGYGFALHLTLERKLPKELKLPREYKKVFVVVNVIGPIGPQ